MRGKRILITRSLDRSTAISKLFQDWNAIPHWIPAICGKPSSPQQLARALKSVETCDWLLLPSPLAIKIFCSFAMRFLPVSHWPKTVVMGETSRSLLQNRYSIQPATVYDFVENGGLAKQMGLKSHERVVVLCSSRGSGPRVAQLVNSHLQAETHEIYDVYCNEKLVQILEELEVPFDAVAFSSPSTVECFLGASKQVPHLQEWLAEACIACIGPATANAICQFGLYAHVICDQPSLENLIWELFRWFSREPKPT